MRTLLFVFGWASLIGSIGDGLIAAVLGWLVATQGADPSITVDQHLRDHLPFLYWVRDVAAFVLPAPVVEWVFGLKALVYFPVRVVVSILIGGWALSAAAKMRPRPTSLRR